MEESERDTRDQSKTRGFQIQRTEYNRNPKLVPDSWISTRSFSVHFLSTPIYLVLRMELTPVCLPRPASAKIWIANYEVEYHSVMMNNGRRAK